LQTGLSLKPELFEQLATVLTTTPRRHHFIKGYRNKEVPSSSADAELYVMGCQLMPQHQQLEPIGPL
jgi:hypothetical protein